MVGERPLGRPSGLSIFDKSPSRNQTLNIGVAHLDKFALLEDVIPFVESHYSAQPDREHRALAGLSMGGGQSLNFGLRHLEAFAWVGGFSSAPNTKAATELVPAPAETAKQLKLLWISCGDKDGLFGISQGFHRYLKDKDVPHIWHVDSGGHTREVWRNDLYLLAQQLSR